MSAGSVAWGISRYEPGTDAEEWLRRSPRSGRPTTRSLDLSLARRLADHLTTLPFATWNFGDSVAFEGLVESSRRTGDERWASFVRGWGRAWATRSRPFVRLDATAPGAALVDVARRYDDHLLTGALRDLADYLLSRPFLNGIFELWESAPLIPPYGEAVTTEFDEALLAHPPACVCVDSLHFDPPFLVALGCHVGEHAYVAAGVDQAAAFVRALQRPDGLFDHFFLEGVEGTFGPGWGRGQGWALLGLLDVLARHPDGPHAPALAALRQGAAAGIGAMVALQREDGHWPVVVTEAGSGDEYSTTAFMITAFARAAELGVVPADTVADALHRATGALAESFDAAGALTSVSAAVYTSTVASHYANVPRGFVVPWGQGPALLAVWEILKSGES
ncbi:unsaturated rhamnogalacturonyl hydrolase [Microbacterium sp. BK668]|nr:unsaturated rhamnogalacturonyl hydrolase [Microbacterium sp. BK668]